MYAREVSSEYIISIICKAHFPSVSEDELTDKQVYRGPTEEHDLGYQGDLGSSFIEELERAVKMTPLGDACQSPTIVHEVKTKLFAYLPENTWTSELKAMDDARLESVRQSCGNSCEGYVQKTSKPVFRTK